MMQARGWDALALHLWAGADAFGSPIAQAFGVNSIPSYVLIDPDGKVAHNEALASTAPKRCSTCCVCWQAGRRSRYTWRRCPLHPSPTMWERGWG
jgi:hypothetical protein